VTPSLPPVVITGSRQLRDQLHLAERHCGIDFDYYDRIPDGRRYAVRREAIILGGDLLALVRKPWRCRGVVLAAVIGPWNTRMLDRAERAGAAYIVELPTALPTLIDAIWRAHHEQDTRPRKQAHR
jgi:hypothetical protein